MKPTFLSASNYSPLGSLQTLGPQGAERTKAKPPGLMITSLVDAFSILMIYLLLGTSQNGIEIDKDLGVKIPKAFFGKTIESDTTLKVINGAYYLDGQQIAQNQIAERLRNLAQGRKIDEQNPLSLVVVADQSRPTEEINPILLAASEAGYSQLKLAVQHEGE